MSPRRASPPPDGPFAFSFDEFEEWHSRLVIGLLEPARATFIRILNEMLDQELSDVDRLRIRVSHSRIKSSSRLWNKMLGERYVERITELADIPDVVDDLVGVRVTCNNLIDVEMFRNIVVSLAPTDATELPAGLCIDPDSERKHSKPSGYRAYHINLHTLVPARHEWKPARGELQVRTLLQDSWGELTHEDTYKPGSNMPELVTQLAKRMADLLATVDDLAQDLRNELDRLAESDVEAQPAIRPPESTSKSAERDSASAAALTAGNVREALLSETRRVVESLTKPAPLAQVAWQVQASFGREVAANWGGLGTFKELLRAAVPEVHIIDVPPGTVIPATVARTLPTSENPEGTASVGSPPEGVPAVVHRLRQRDSGVPAVSSERLSGLLEVVAQSLDPTVWEEIDIQANLVGTRELNQLTKYSRSIQVSDDRTPSRAATDYAFKSLYFSQNLRPGLSKDDVASVLCNWFFARASRLGFVVDAERDRTELEDWFKAALNY